MVSHSGMQIRQIEIQRQIELEKIRLEMEVRVKEKERKMQEFIQREKLEMEEKER